MLIDEFLGYSYNLYKRLKEIVKKTKSKIKIENKKGLPFIFHKNNLSMFYLIVIFLRLGTIFLTSSMVSRT